ncbi:hypothetical protein [Hydrocarboniclastica marina]|uniref:Integrase SAM-like N-terminal domain-containing protein n=1 Tax=Hydrocarboniclastica marina TaxID=2259620 RepID=A0A4P7XHN1_9ALTE|nr:hypothetical protein [Hydrocarboniclastica marina]MAL98028.1 hypothetical protein [Alteromonadaceae bacterium]QCF26536.1 hypothetical protein soil367_11650 [Hydrocarboniclastica marina]
MNLSYIYRRIKAKEGAERARRRHLNRIAKMTSAIEQRFPKVKRVQQIDQKHCKWLIEHWCNPSTEKDYRSSLRLLLEASDRSPEWLKQLGMASTSTGGRPREVSVVRSRSSRYWME